MLRYYAEDIWGMGEAAPRLTLDDLARMRPGFGEYFKRWLVEQESLWDTTPEDRQRVRQRVDAILAILAGSACQIGVSPQAGSISDARSIR